MRRPPKPFPAAVLFDMDGLLIDTEPLWFAVETQIVDELGGHWDHRDHATLVGSPLSVSSAFIAKRSGGVLTAQQAADELLGRMATQLRTAPPLQPGVADLIAELDAAGIAKALVSSSFQVLVDAVLDAVAPIAFDAVVTGDAVANNKPHPEPYLTAARLLGAEPQDCVALEDSPTGAESATNAGCCVIAVPSVAPIEPARRRVVVPSLHGIDLAFVRAAFGS